MPIEIRELHIRVEVRDPPAAAVEDAMLVAARDASHADGLLHEAAAQQEAMLAWHGSMDEADGTGQVSAVFVGDWGFAMHQY